MNTVSGWTTKVASVWLFAAVLIVTALPAFTAERAADPIETVTVYGQRTLLSLRRDMFTTEKLFYEHFNQINDVRKFEVICQRRPLPSSRFFYSDCTPRYIIDARVRRLAPFIVNGITNLNSMVNPSKQVTLEEKQRTQALAHMQAMINAHPELEKKYIAFRDSTAAYRQRKALTLAQRQALGF